MLFWTSGHGIWIQTRVLSIIITLKFINHRGPFSFLLFCLVSLYSILVFKDVVTMCISRFVSQVLQKLSF